MGIVVHRVCKLYHVNFPGNGTRWCWLVLLLYCYRGTHPEANTKDTRIFRERNNGFRRNAEAILRYEQRITIDFLLQRLTQKPATQSSSSHNVL